MKLTEIIGAKVAIHCEIQAEADTIQLITMLDYADMDRWKDYGNICCIAIDAEGGTPMLTANHIDAFKHCNWTIISASDFINSNK